MNTELGFSLKNTIKNITSLSLKAMTPVTSASSFITSKIIKKPEPKPFYQNIIQQSINTAAKELNIIKPKTEPVSSLPIQVQPLPIPTTSTTSTTTSPDYKKYALAAGGVLALILATR